MRFYGLALAAGALMVGACGGGEKAPSTDSAATAAPAAAAPETPAAQPAATPAAGGTTHEVKMMVENGTAYKFVPASLTIKAGDVVNFVNVSGGPHNVALDAATIPEDMKAVFTANMKGAADFTGPMMVNPNEVFGVSFAGVKPGKYGVICTPHLAMNMKMDITVQ